MINYKTTNRFNTKDREKCIKDFEKAKTGMTTIIYTDEKMDVSKGVRYCNQNELERLHNIPPGYTSCLNKAHAGNLIGDGWEIKSIEHTLKYM